MIELKSGNGTPICREATDVQTPPPSIHFLIFLSSIKKNENYQNQIHGQQRQKLHELRGLSFVLYQRENSFADLRFTALSKRGFEYSEE